MLHGIGIQMDLVAQFSPVDSRWTQHKNESQDCWNPIGDKLKPMKHQWTSIKNVINTMRYYGFTWWLAYESQWFRFRIISSYVIFVDYMVNL